MGASAELATEDAIGGAKATSAPADAPCEATHSNGQAGHGRRGGGGWKAALFILATEATERLAFYSIAANLVSYLTFQMHEPLPASVTLVTNWVGAAYVLGIPGAFIADAYLGRFLTIAIYSGCYILGLAVLTLSASAKSLRPPSCDVLAGAPCPRASGSQKGALLAGLYLTAIGTGGIKPCVSPFGADQLAWLGGEASSSFFNWFFFSVNVGALLSYTVVVYVQDNVSWAVGYAIPLAAMLASLGVLLYGMPRYSYQPPAGSPLARFARVIIAAFRNRARPLRENALFELPHDQVSPGVARLSHTDAFRCLDKAAVVPDPPTRGTRAPCTVTQVEELKLFLRIVPILATTVFLWTGYGQLLTFFVKQGTTLDRNLGPHFQIPPASLPVFSVLNALLVLPLYDRVVVPLARKHVSRDPRGFTPLQRMGFGLFVSVLSMVVAAVVERKRLRVVRAGAGGAGAALPMSIFWLVPQYFLVGLGEIFTYVGQLEFFYAEVSEGMRSLSTSLFIAELGVGSWVSSVLVTLVRRVTGTQPGRGWILDDIDASRVDRFYWLLAVLSAVNFVLFLGASHLHRSRNPQQQTISPVSESESNSV